MKALSSIACLAAAILLLGFLAPERQEVEHSSYDGTPALVVGITVNQMRPDFIARYWDRGAILPAGHTGDAYWHEASTGTFFTSTYYHDEFPERVQEFSDRDLVTEYLSQPCETLHPISLGLNI